MIDVALTAFVTLFVVMDPIGLAHLFVGMTQGADQAHRRAMAIKAVVTAALILTAFALGGEWFLIRIGIGIPAFRVAGGIMLFLIALELVFEKRELRRAESAEKTRRRQPTEDISVFPLAIPLMAGPGAITSVMLLVSRHQGDPAMQGVVLAVMAGVLLLCLTLFLMSGVIERLIGQTVTGTIRRILGVILAALAAQFVMDGVKAGLLGG